MENPPGLEKLKNLQVESPPKVPAQVESPPKVPAHKAEFAGPNVGLPKDATRKELEAARAEAAAIPQLTGEVKKNKPISRRDFLKLAVSAAVGAVVGRQVGTRIPVPKLLALMIERIVLHEKIAKLDNLLNCNDKEYSASVADMCREIGEMARNIGYIGYPNAFYFSIAGDLSRYKKIKNRATSLETKAAIAFLKEQIEFWGTIPPSRGEAKFTGFEGIDAQKYRQFIFDATMAVWGTDKYVPFLGEVELKDRAIGLWDRIGHIMLGVFPDQPLSSMEGRKLAANMALHEVIVGHGMDPSREVTGYPGPYRFCDMRDVLRLIKLWYSVSDYALKFLSVVRGPELSRQKAYNTAKQSLSSETLDSLGEHSEIYNSLSDIGKLLSEKSPVFFKDLDEVQQAAVQSAIEKLGKLDVADKHKNAALALLIHNKLQQLNPENLRPSKLVRRLNWILLNDVRQEKEMFAEVMRHVLTMEKSPSPEVESEFEALENFVEELLKLFGTGKTLSQARTDLEDVMDKYINSILPNEEETLAQKIHP